MKIAFPKVSEPTVLGFFDKDFVATDKEHAYFAKIAMPDGRIVMAIPTPKVGKGGPGSGNFGHAGRPGKQGGSAPEGTSPLKDQSDFKIRLVPVPKLENNEVSSEELRSFKSKLYGIETINGKAVKVNRLDLGDKEKLVSWYPSLEKVIRLGINEVVVADDIQAFADEYSKDIGKTMTPEELTRDRVVAYHVGGKGKIVLYQNSEDVFFHECGHELWDNLPGLQKKAFVDGYKSDDLDHFTGYADTQVKEGFAESYMLYRKVKKGGFSLSMGSVPATFNYMDEAIQASWERKKKKLHIV